MTQHEQKQRLDDGQKRANKRDPLLIFLVIVLILLLLTIAFVLLRHKSQVQRPDVKLADLSGKIWVSYGDSITDGGFWQADVADAFGLQHIDQGVGGTCVAGYGSLAFWQAGRLDQIIAAQPTLLTIMGGTNDFFSNFPLGDESQFDLDLADKEVATFLGAYSYMIEYLQMSLPDTTIVIMATPVNYLSFSDTPCNDRGDSIADYQKACQQVADHYGLIFVPLRQLQADPVHWEQDFWDGIHPNLEGAAKISQELIQALKQYQ